MLGSAQRIGVQRPATALTGAYLATQGCCQTPAKVNRTKLLLVVRCNALLDGGARKRIDQTQVYSSKIELIS
jgi:hypothetical protein